MLFAILVAAKANIALGRGRIIMTRVTNRARLMLDLCVQAGELFTLMTSRTSRNARDSVRAVGAMTSLTAAADSTVRAGLLGAVTIGACLQCRQACVRLVAIQASLVALGRRLLLHAMAVGAGRCLRAGVRFMATDAARVSGFD
jgi:hypothetical protein